MSELSLLLIEIFMMICEKYLYKYSYDLFNLMMTNRKNCNLIIPVLYKFMKHNLKTVECYLKLLYKELPENDQNYIDMYVSEKEYEFDDDHVEVKKLVWNKGKNMFNYSSMIKLIDAYHIF
ncbi:3314_t:CDS:1 [Scutellospora calospora]|uniref:3314_t:CDS:1 n=1 Tax=Scutellospora calospora TaxID=85575 RepID=A0ACA9K970_9GLOM|nr:3314_t:CDS:1 [Scutellospora calospora]